MEAGRCRAMLHHLPRGLHRFILPTARGTRVQTIDFGQSAVPTPCCIRFGQPIKNGVCICLILFVNVCRIGCDHVDVAGPRRRTDCPFFYSSPGGGEREMIT